MKLDPKGYIQVICLTSKEKFVKEHKFLTDRKFKFDWAFPDLKIAIEYEGVFSAKSRHTQKAGYSKDCEKYNLASINGWQLLRYTALNYKNLKEYLQLLITKTTDK